MTKRTAVRTTLRAVATGAFATTLTGLAPQAAPAPLPQAPSRASIPAAHEAVAADGRTASVWTVRPGAAWKVVNIADGDDETRHAKGVARAYGDRLPGSAYERRGEAGGYGPEAAAGAEKHRAQPARAQRPVTAGAFTVACLPVTAATTVAGAAALLALGLSASAALRRRRSG
ncbi:hypothetical protein [Streptomyces tubercidicus]|uniref:Gram-positive cocci surface proteins LPxTG domain-containing protein n=1 Tax=Streptomyces tubercidicus TaxID=47759 RepID=A0A640UXL8_9ACTN|nr:hypothetical protein [Streptomyces tubercidicus]WAU14820.1 hypothetical protein STRTU_005465 [Streptomyces tubercidicus]GFE40609.1 hypothetical protein Stube_52820 [Streptomyces tubercidicus]